MSKVSVRNRSYYTTDSSISFELDGVEYNLETQIHPVDEYCTPLIARVGDKVIFGYLVPDDDAGAPDEWDGEGKVVLNERGSRSSEIREALGLTDEGYPNLNPVAEKYLEEWVLAPERRTAVLDWVHNEKRPWNVGADEWWFLGNPGYDDYDITDIAWRELGSRYCYPPNSEDSQMYRDWYKFAIGKWDEMRASGEIGTKYTQLLDVYDHSGIHVSISNTRHYPDQQWDVSHGGGAWIPDQPAIDNIDWPEYLKNDTPEEHAERAMKYAQGCIETWNMYFSGDVYGHVVEVHEFNEDGTYDSDTKTEDEDSCWGHYGHDYAQEYLKEEFDATVKHLKEAA